MPLAYTYFSIPKITAALYFVNLAGDGCICNSSCSIVRVYSRFPRQLQCSCYLENLGGGVWECEWLIHPDSLVCDRLTGMSQACLECHEAIHNILFHHTYIAPYFCSYVILQEYNQTCSSSPSAQTHSYIHGAVQYSLLLRSLSHAVLWPYFGT